MAKYSYISLPPDQASLRSPPYTRLLILAAGREPEPLRGVLELINIESSPAFEALSYTWGSDSVDTPLYLEGGDLPVRGNLDAALRSLRLRSQARRLWIDALCINQEDVQERTRQVQYMRLIYKRATCVIVWLGLKSQEVEEAFTLAIQISEFCNNATETDIGPDGSSTSSTMLSQAMDHMNTQMGLMECASVPNSLETHFKTLAPQELHEAMALIMLKLNPSGADSLKNLLRRPYFSRIWCIQEVLLSSWSLAKCEDLEINLMDLISCAHLLHNKRDSLFGQVLHFWGFVHAARTGEHKLGKVEGSMNSLLDCLAAGRNFEASDPRDKVFTLLGISDEGLNPFLALWNPVSRFEMPDSTRRFIETNRNAISRANAFCNYEYSHPALIPDYSRDLVEVYRDLTRFFVRLPPQHLRVLSYISHLDDPSEGSFPSWVPKWFQKQSTTPLMAGGYNAGLIFGPTRHVPLCHDNPLRGAPQNPDILQLDGFRFDVVHKVSQFMQHDMQKPVNIQHIWSQLFDLPYSFPSEVQYRPDESLDLAFCLTLTAGFLAITQHLNIHKGIKTLAKDIPQRYEDAKMLVRAWMKVETERLKKQEAIIPCGGDTLPPTTVANEPSRTTQDDAPQAMDIALSKDWQHWVKVFTHNRCVYLTQKGLLGLGPKMMREGDEICVLYGGYVPFVLRPQRNGTHIMVGDTYVHDNDLMWGKIADAVNTNRSSMRNQTFILE